MSTEKKILEELRRFNQINSYLLKEQGEVPPAPEEVPPAANDAAPAPDAGDVAKGAA